MKFIDILQFKNAMFPKHIWNFLKNREGRYDLRRESKANMCLHHSLKYMYKFAELFNCNGLDDEIKQSTNIAQFMRKYKE